MLAHCCALIDAAGPGVRRGQAAARLLRAARLRRLARARGDRARTPARAGLLVLADGKRGDVPVTAAAYAQALDRRDADPFGAVAGLGADAFTANPLLGRDALEPLVDAARAAGAGVFVLVRTSNPGAADVAGPRARRRRAAVGAPRRAWSPSSAAGAGPSRASTTSAPSPARPRPSTSPACAS